MNRGSSGRWLVVVLVGLGLLSASCSLPTDDGVRRAGTVQPDVAERRGGTLELPPGPQPGARPSEIVAGFLEAQISGANRHGVSRKYLTERATWDDETGVTVYRAGLLPSLVDGDPSGAGPLSYEVRFDKIGAIGADGAADVSAPAPRTETFQLVRDKEGEWRIDELAAGLLLSTDTRDAAFSAATVYFLPARTPGPAAHLVADRQLVPVGSEPDLLVRRVLAGPSRGLGDSGRTAAPPGTDLVSPVKLDASGAGVVVDLTAQADELLPSAREALAAQLVWTLRRFPDLLRLTLLVDGKPFLVGRNDQPLLVRSAFAVADPQGTQQTATAIVGGKLRGIGGSVPASARSATSVRDLAVDPRSGHVALLTGSLAEGTLGVGPANGPLRTIAQGAGLTSPTWGDGAYGVWLLRTGASSSVLVTRGGTPRRVAFPGLPVLDASSTLRVSRDGSRVLLVSGGELILARIVPPAEGATGDAAQVPVIQDVRQLRSVGTVAADWLDDTRLAVLVSETRPLLLVSIDGLSQDAVNQPLQDVRAQSVAALGDLPLLVGAVSDDAAPVPTRTPARPPPDANHASDPKQDPAGAASPGPVVGSSSKAPVAEPPSQPLPEARLFSGRPGQPFDIELRDAVRPRYPG